MIERSGKEQAVLENWPAHLESNLILLVGIAWQPLQIRLEAIGIQHIIIEIEISDAMKLIPSRPCYRVRDKPGSSPVLGREVVGGNAILFDRLGRNRRQRS